MPIVNETFAGSDFTDLVTAHPDWNILASSSGIAQIYGGNLEVTNRVYAYNDTSAEADSSIVILPTREDTGLDPASYWGARRIGPAINVTATDRGQHFYLNSTSNGAEYTTISIFSGQTWIANSGITAGYLLSASHELRIVETSNNETDVGFDCYIDGVLEYSGTATTATSVTGNDGFFVNRADDGGFSIGDPLDGVAIIDSFSSGDAVATFDVTGLPTSIKVGDTGLTLTVANADITPTSGNTTVFLDGVGGEELTVSDVTAGVVTFDAPAHTDPVYAYDSSGGYALYIVVADENVTTSTIPYLPPTGYGYINLTAITSQTDITAIAPLVAGNQLEYESTITDFTVSLSNSGVITLTGAGVAASSSFEVRAWDGTSWGSFANQTGAVISVTEAPTIQAVGGTTASLVFGTPYPGDPAWTWSDNTVIGQAITSWAWVGLEYDANTPGSYTRQATATNLFNGSSSTTENYIVTVQVEQVAEAPTIQEVGGAFYTLDFNTAYPGDPAWTWSDNLVSDQAITSWAWVGDAYDAGVPSTYTRRATATNLFNGSSSTTADLTVTVAGEELAEAPTIQTVGGTEVTLQLGVAYTGDPAWTWSDNLVSDQAITSWAWVGDAYDANTAGDYVRRATATNLYLGLSNTTMDYTVTVEVGVLSQAPVINVVDASATVPYGTAYPGDPAWTWYDNLFVDQAMTSWADEGAAYDANTAGDYVRRATATNAFGGSSSTTADFTVTVEAEIVAPVVVNQPPTINTFGVIGLTLEFGTEYLGDPGWQWSDNVVSNMPISWWNWDGAVFDPNVAGEYIRKGYAANLYLGLSVAVETYTVTVEEYVPPPEPPQPTEPEHDSLYENFVRCNILEG